MVKYIFLEGLPGVGKTTIANTIKSMNLSDVKVVDEIIYLPILENISCTEDDFITNDILKINKYKTGIVVIDRGPISSLSYSQVKKIINSNYDISHAEKSFLKLKRYLKNNSKTIYLTNKNNYLLTVNNKLSPYGTIENQKLLDNITQSNIKKYCKNYVIIEYNKTNIKQVINEIFS